MSRYINSYNFIDKIIARFRSAELKKNFLIKDKNILDFGCGSNFKKLKKNYKSCNSLTLVDRYGESFSSEDVTYINYSDDLEILDAKTKKNYDIIVLSAVIEHLDRPEDVLNILKNKLRTGGSIFLTAPGKRSKFILELMAFKLGIINADLVKEHKRYYDRDEYVLLSEKTNLKIFKFYYFEFGFNTACVLK